MAHPPASCILARAGLGPRLLSGPWDTLEMLALESAFGSEADMPRPQAAYRSDASLFSRGHCAFYTQPARSFFSCESVLKKRKKMCEAIDGQCPSIERADARLCRDARGRNGGRFAS
jgi:hypothetical protein